MGGGSSKGKLKINSGTASSTSCSPSTTGTSAGDILEVTVCKLDDLKNGEMKVFDLGEDGSILLVKDNNRISALGTKCTHYGAPLVKGVLCEGRIRCPWHGACFNAETGDIEDFPGLDSLPVYEVTVVHGDIKVKASKKDLKQNRRTKVLAPQTSEDTRTFIIIGGGGAAITCLETLRQEKFSGRLVLISKEKNLPYDRPKLSKALNSSARDLALRKEEHYKTGDVELWLDREVLSLDVTEKMVQYSGGSIHYDAVFIATGGKPRMLDVSGNDLENVVVLRTPEDANLIFEKSKSKNVVILGTSFIGMEVAAFLADKAGSVTVVGRSDVPFANILGKDIGSRLQQLHEEKGVTFKTNTGVQKFEGDEGRLTAVVLTNDERLPAELCVVGIGVTPLTELVSNTSIARNKEGHIIVDKCMRTTVTGVYAGGDIVAFPLSTYEDKLVNIGHWQMAKAHGRAAAHAMLGNEKELRTVPFFWCMMFGKSLRYTGYGTGFDEVIIDGNLESLAFVAYYTSGPDVVAVATMNMDPIASKFASFVYAGHKLSKEEIQKDPTSWQQKMDAGGHC